MDPLLLTFKERFNDSVFKILKNKADNCVFITKEKYVDLINVVRELKTKSSRKTPSDYQRLKRYDVIQVGNCDKLIAPISEDNPDIKFFVHVEEMFDILHETHLAVGHGGRNKMTQELKVKYRNITKESIMIYLNLCETCIRNKPTRVVIPRIFEKNVMNFGSNDSTTYDIKPLENDFLTKEIREIEEFPLENSTSEEQEQDEFNTSTNYSEIQRENELLKRKLLLAEHNQQMKVIQLQYENELLKQKLIKYKLRKYETNCD